MLVMKFGGTSVQDAQALARVSWIIREHSSEPGGIVVVLSATCGTTNDLLLIAREAGSGVNVNERVESLALRHLTILAELAPSADTRAVGLLLDDVRIYARALGVLGECTDQSLDHIAAYGELLSTSILYSAFIANSFSASLVDVRSIVRTDHRFCSARVDMDETRRLSSRHLSPLCATGHVVITQGFLGSTVDGLTTSLGRGGSDYSGAILGAALGAREIQIWTDVSGVYSADPRVVPDASPIAELSFAEVRALALYGAKVLHPDAIAPAIEVSIPVRVLNTFQPQDSGTRIVANTESSAAIHAVSIVSGCTYIQCSVELAAHILHVPVIADNVMLSSSSIETSSLVIRTHEEQASVALDVAITHGAYTRANVTVLAVSGPSVGTPAVLSAITNSLPASSLHAIFSGTTTHVTFLVIEEPFSSDALLAVHNLIIHRR